jgi:hypothetical protein
MEIAIHIYSNNPGNKRGSGFTDPGLVGSEIIYMLGSSGSGCERNLFS